MTQFFELDLCDSASDRIAAIENQLDQLAEMDFWADDSGELLEDCTGR